MKRKRITSFMLTAFMVLSMFLPTVASAENYNEKTELTNAKVIIVSGETEWPEIQTEIDAILANESDASIKILGVGDNAVIKMIGITEPVDGLSWFNALELQSDTAFKNVTFQLQGQQSTNQSPNIAIFANGHKLYIDENVKTVCVGSYEKRMYIFGGGNKTAVENTHIEINGGDWERIYGGSYRADCGDTYVHLSGNAAVLNVYGGCYGGVTAGNIDIKFGSGRRYLSNVPNKNYRLAYVMGGGHDIQGEGQIADVTGEKIEIKILPGALLSEVNGAENSMISCDDIYITVDEGARVLNSVTGGATTSSAESWSLADGYSPGGTQYIAKSNIHVVFNGEGRLDDAKAYSVSVTGGGIWGHVEGDIDVSVNGNVEYVYGGSHEGDVTGNINITINGGVYAGGHNADAEIGDIYDWFGGTVTSGCIDGTVTGDITTTIGKDAEVHAVIGGSDDGSVVGNTTVHVYGTILKKNYESANRFLSGAGCVFGGGYLGSSSSIDITDVSGKTNVYIHEGSDVQGDVYGGGLTARCSGGTNVVVSGTVQGDVYGGSWLQESTNQYGQYELGYVGETYVELNSNGSANNVYGGGRIGNVHGGSTILLKDNANVNNVYGTGNAYTTFYHYGHEYTFGPIAITTTGDAIIQVQDSAVVTDTIYGYEAIQIDNADKKLLNGRSEVYFKQSDNNSIFKRVKNADLVQVTNGSKVEIDNEHKDNEQLVNVVDLTIDDNAKLRIGADAHILGNYRGDKAKSGTLEIPAGKCLTADGTVTDLTKISIYDFNGVIPEKAQIYVISGAGSTTADGDFTWIDTRNGVYMDWKAHETIQGATQWWLVNDPDPQRYGGLAISKIVNGDAGDKQKDFNFTVTLGDKTINGIFGDMEFKAGIATFSLKHGENKTSTGLPAGTIYEVTETEQNQDGYTTTSEGADGTIVKGQTAEVKFTNTKYIPRSDLTVTKMVAGNAGEKGRDFHFTVALSSTSINGIFGDMEFKDGVASFTLKHGDSVTANDLPAGITYTVTEIEADQDGYITTFSGETGEILKGIESKADFTNVKDEFGDLTVTKTVAGNAGEKGRDFHFTVALSSTSINGIFGDMEFKDGVASFTLKHGESKTAIALPAGVNYIVTEAEANKDGYVTTSMGATGSIVNKTEAKAEFMNTKNEFSNLTVSKTVAGNASDKKKEFNFTVTLSDKTISGIFGDMEFKDGVASFTLKHGESKTAIALPAGIGYMVVEDDYSGDGYVTASIDATGITVKDKTAEVKFTNTKDISTPIDPTEPNDPSDPNNLDDTKPPQTSDTGNPLLWFVLMAVSAVGLSIVLLIQKHQKNKAE